MERFELIEGFNGWDLHPDDTGNYVLFEDAIAIRRKFETEIYGEFVNHG